MNWPVPNEIVTTSDKLALQERKRSQSAATDRPNNMRQLYPVAVADCHALHLRSSRQVLERAGRVQHG